MGKRSWLQPQPLTFEGEINDFFIHFGIGWQLRNGQIVMRGTEAFEGVVSEATSALRKRQDGPLRRSTFMKRCKISPVDRRRICRALSITRWARWNVWRAT